jgi:hypothetical protein
MYLIMGIGSLSLERIAIGEMGFRSLWEGKKFKRKLRIY